MPLFSLESWRCSGVFARVRAWRSPLDAPAKRKAVRLPAIAAASIALGRLQGPFERRHNNRDRLMGTSYAPGPHPMRPLSPRPGDKSGGKTGARKAAAIPPPALATFAPAASLHPVPPSLPADPTRIRLASNREVNYWCQTLNCTETRLRNAVLAVGPLAADVRAYLTR